MSDLQGLVGTELELAINDGNKYCGVVESVTSGGLITLQNVVNITTNQTYKSSQRFHRSEVKKHKFLKKTDIRVEVKKDRTLIQHKGVPSHLVGKSTFNPSHALKQKLKDGLTCLPEVQLHDVKGFGAKEGKLEMEGYVFISDADSLFVVQRQHLRSQSSVAIAFHGQLIGRHGALSIVAVATGSTVYLLDALALGDNLFSDQGLRPILIDPDIVKVVCDCRLMSDMLHHKYDLQMKNVYDVQAADIILFRLRRKGDLPRYVSPLPKLLIDILKIDSKDVFFYRFRNTKDLRKLDEEVWLRRPLADEQRECAIQSVRFLLRLQSELQSQIMAEFTASVDLFQRVVRDVPETAYDAAVEDTKFVPRALASVVKRFESRFKDPVDDKGFVLNKQRILDPSVIFSKDSTWSSRDPNKKDTEFRPNFGSRSSNKQSSVPNGGGNRPDRQVRGVQEEFSTKYVDVRLTDHQQSGNPASDKENHVNNASAGSSVKGLVRNGNVSYDSSTKSPVAEKKVSGNGNTTSLSSMLDSIRSSDGEVESSRDDQSIVFRAAGNERASNKSKKGVMKEAQYPPTERKPGSPQHATANVPKRGRGRGSALMSLLASPTKPEPNINCGSIPEHDDLRGKSSAISSEPEIDLSQLKFDLAPMPKGRGGILRT